ncbi:uncharacterized protein EURHEDRAFT_251776 [Aspergillus ruber CBS 135680]|uniref:Uncharacterized protein n=1 Tax=Aspergillus ruber (strain CBS 135680) TaxID=1388766 RepID=A0A017S258_ASPRC|nr:uncharacterized protein EURHEDRAFT_251776 [Aspergillus ruber CBS 135680]EYE91108.1 hypothetical protein EURHEDRAFT_251776 [Aspergillus ruber CBS 135680]
MGNVKWWLYGGGLQSATSRLRAKQRSLGHLYTSSIWTMSPPRGSYIEINIDYRQSIDSRSFGCSIFSIYNAFSSNNEPIGANRVNITGFMPQNGQKNKTHENKPAISYCSNT